MRRTQQNADRQRRRGVRSRLVACVAAVAMLVTSVAAGTAVAAELGGGDAADQTTQNTATLEQQGTGDTGDNNQTTTNGDGQADGDQSSDADSGSEGDEGTADNGAADGNGTIESDAQAQGDIATKNVNAAPAPQSDDQAIGAAAQAEGSGTLLLDESFTGTSVSGEVNFFGTACLTAASSGSYSCNNDKYPKGLTGGVQAYQGKANGYLQLTDDSNSDKNSKGSQTGTVLYDRVLQSRLGLDIEFDTWQFSTENINDDGDGIGFFLTDGNYGLSQQGPMGSDFGGALGYSAIRDGDSTEPGIAHGVLGVGLDVYGNFSSSKDVGGSDVRYDDTDSWTGTNLHANSVSVRGAGVQDNSEWTKGYGLLDGRLDATHTTGSRPFQQSQSMLTTKEPGVGRAVGHEDDATHVRIQLQPLEDGATTQKLTVTITDGDGHSKSKTWELSEPLPTLIKFGFSASTGQNSSAHFIRNVKVHTVKEAESGILMTKTVRREGDGATDKTLFATGDIVPYDFTVQNVGDKALYDVNVVDEHKMVEGVTCDVAVLGVGEQTTCHGSLTLSDEDTQSGTFINTATAYGRDEDGNQVSSEASVDINTVKSLGAPDHRKRIRDNEDGTYTLALDATAKSSSTTIEGEGDPLDIVLVLDRSGSMDNDLGSQAWYPVFSVNKYGDYWVLDNGQYQEAQYRSGYWYVNNKEVTPKNSYTSEGVQFYTSNASGFISKKYPRMDALKSAVDGFVMDIAESNKSMGDHKHRLAVVSFSSNATQTVNLTDCTDDNVTNIINKVNGLDADGSTYPNEAFEDVHKIFHQSTGRKKIVVFFTDGYPGYSADAFDNKYAVSAINEAYTLKSVDDATIYSVGVVEGADPNASINGTSNDSWLNQKLNAYLHAISSNYPDARGFTDSKRGAKASGDYYFAADNADELNKVFEDISGDITVTQSYKDLWITDDLSEYARMTVGITTTGNLDNDGYARVSNASGAGIRVWQRDGNAEEGTDSTAEGFFGDEMESGYELWWNAEKQSIRVKIQNPEGGKLYTLTFDVKPSDKAMTGYADNGYNVDQGNGTTGVYTGEEGTDLPGNTTSYSQEGFRSNDRAYVSYRTDKDDEMSETDYKHPVLQVKAATLSGDAFVKVSKTVKGRGWLDDESFKFDLEAKDDAPLPVDAEGRSQSSITIGEPAGGSDTNMGSFGAITFTGPGTYVYMLKEYVPAKAAERHGLDYSDAVYTITVVVSTDMTTTVTVTDSDDESVEDRVASFVNSLAPYEYAASEHLGLHKELDGLGLESGTFKFSLSPVAVDGDGVLADVAGPVEGMTLPAVLEVLNGDANGDGQITDADKVDDGYDLDEYGAVHPGYFDFGTITFSKPDTYYVRVVENKDAKPESGYYVFDKHALYVRYEVTVNQNGELDVTRSVATYVPTDDAPDPVNGNLIWTSEQDGAIPEETLTWHNTYVAPVSALPLTGGDSTARTLLLAGGGVLLVAGVAWLLARRRRV